MVGWVVGRGGICGPCSFDLQHVCGTKRAQPLVAPMWFHCVPHQDHDMQCVCIAHACMCDDAKNT